MRVSSRADYGVRALFDLAQRFGQGPVQSRDIASRQGIPEAYLHQVMGALGRAGLVRSTRGPAGGHELIPSPDRITVWDVIAVLDGPDRRAHPHRSLGEAEDVVHEVWHGLQAQGERYLRDISFARLLERAALANAPTYAI
jgi:Rrf2 family transcriptional regulator, cysteine metabolism repressor